MKSGMHSYCMKLIDHTHRPDRPTVYTVDLCGDITIDEVIEKRRIRGVFDNYWEALDCSRRVIRDKFDFWGGST